VTLANETTLTHAHWKRSVLACMADYIDAGGIVAASAGLALWAKTFGMSSSLVGLLGAIGINTGAYAVGSLVGGRLGDLFGRKRIYQWDLLVYIFGGLWIVFAQGTWNILVGLVLMGLAVGADVPTSWALIGEIAPRHRRGMLVGLTSVFWNLGPIVTLLLSLVLAPYGLLGVRIVFAHLIVVAFITWLLRRRMGESEIWEAAASAARSGRNAPSGSRLRQLTEGRNAKWMTFIFVVHMLGSIAAGTFGFFLPYLLNTLGAHGQAGSVGLQSLSFLFGALGVGLLFMPLVDRVNRRGLYGIAGVVQVGALLLLVFLPLTSTAVVVAFLVLNALAGSCGQEQMYRVWCQELFPTMIRTTAQGLVIAVQKSLLGVWIFYVPRLSSGHFHAFTWVLVLATAGSVLVGVLFMPRPKDNVLEASDEVAEPAAA
jgi:MFS transporter, SP family, inositol transporter